jgi:hypothetical protein
MNQPKTTSQRVAAHRARQKALGITEVRGIYSPLSCHAEIKAFAKSITKQQKSKEHSDNK